MTHRSIWIAILGFVIISLSAPAYAQEKHKPLEVTIYANPPRETGNSSGDDRRQPGTDRGHDHDTGNNTDNNVSGRANNPASDLRRGELVGGNNWEALVKKQLQENTSEVGTYTLKSGNKYIEVDDGDKIQLPSPNYRANGSRAILNRVKIPAGYLYTLTIVSGTDLGRVDKATEIIKKAKDFVLPEEIQAAIEGIGIGPAGPVEDQAYYDFSENGRYVAVRILYIK